MVLHPALRGMIGGVAGLLLVWLAWEGISGGLTQWPNMVTLGQRAQYVTQIAYGGFAAIVLITAFRWQQFRKVADVCFVISTGAAAGLASVVWGASSVLVGVASALGAAAVAAVIVWLLRVGTRKR